MNICDWERLHRSRLYKIAHGGHVEYANQLIFKLDQDNLSESVEKKNCEDRMNIGVYVDLGYAN